MNDGCEGLLVYLGQQAMLTDLIGDQIVGSKHLFGSKWEIPSEAVVLTLHGGYVPDATMRTTRIYAVSYGQSYWSALRVASTILRIIQEFDRTEVAISGGRKVLLHNVNIDSEVTQVWEDELEIPAYGLHLLVFSSQL